jgi:hypothetical protein
MMTMPFGFSAENTGLMKGRRRKRAQNRSIRGERVRMNRSFVFLHLMLLIL